MLLQNRPSVSLRAILIAALLSIFIILTANHYLFPSTPYNPFHFTSSSCSPLSETEFNLPIISQAIPPPPLPTITITQTQIEHVAPQTITVSVSPEIVTTTILADSPAPTFPTHQQSLISSGSHIPEKLWYKLGPKGLSDDSKSWIDTCLTQNPTFRHEFLTDVSGDHYVSTYYSHRPEIVELYLSLPIPILKADLLRYLILYAEGGVWSDLDVSCEGPSIRTWIPVGLRAGTKLVVGLEFDWAWEDDNFLHSQFASWTILSAPQSPHMNQVILDIITGIHEKASEHNVEVKSLTYDMIGDVVDLTGPKRMTRSIVKSLEMTLGETIDDRNVSGIKEPKLLGDVLIIPGNGFAASQNGYPEDQGRVFVTHHYAGTWKNDHGGEMAR